MLKLLLSHSFIRMAFIGGTGWLLDATVYWLIAVTTNYVFIANVIGNICGIFFSFSFGLKYAFKYHGKFLYKQFIMYLVFTASLIPVFSGILWWLVTHGILGLVTAKIAITIPSFIANYLCLKWLAAKAHKDHHYV